MALTTPLDDRLADRRSGEAPRRASGSDESKKTSAPWTFLTNHSHVLLCLHQESYIRLREVATMVGITERAVQRIVRDLEEAGEIQRIRSGRRNRYVVDPTRPLRHPLEAHRTIGELLDLLSRPGDEA